MSIEPKCPKILKAKSKKKQITSSTKNISCWQDMFKSNPASRSPIKTLQKMNQKQNKILANFKQVPIAKTNQPLQFIRSVSPVNHHLNGSIQGRSFVSPNRKPVMNSILIQNQIQNRKSIQYFQKQQLFFRTKIDDLNKRIQHLEIQNKSLKQQNQILQKKKSQSDKIIVLYNQKFNETQSLKNSLNHLHKTIFNQQKTIENIHKNQYKFKIQKQKQKQKQKEVLVQVEKIRIAEDILKDYKQHKIVSLCYKQQQIKQQTPSKISHISSNSYTKQSQIQSQFSLKNKQTGFTAVSQSNIYQEMRKLRSVYQKPKLKDKTINNINNGNVNQQLPYFKGGKPQSQYTFQNSQINCLNQYIQSQIHQIKFDNLISVEIIDESVEGEEGEEGEGLRSEVIDSQNDI